MHEIEQRKTFAQFWLDPFVEKREPRKIWPIIYLFERGLGSSLGTKNRHHVIIRPVPGGRTEVQVVQSRDPGTIAPMCVDNPNIFG